MYTQCPKCNAAFRITVDVLQQARGQVRCGNCDAAFNALDHLTEEAPVLAESQADGADDLERSQLLETLDRLAGSEEVRIEDTGVEWLVVEDGEDDDGNSDNDIADAPADEHDEAAADSSEDGSASMRWVIEDANDLAPDDAFDDDDAASTLASDEPLREEPRYDDNTELPDDFEEQHHYSAPSEPPQRRASDQFEFAVENDEAQADLELSEPDDWSDLLNDIHGPGGERPDAADNADGGDDDQEVASDTATAATDSARPDEPSEETPESADVDDAASLAAAMEPAPDEEQEIAMVASQLDDLLETMGSGQEQALDLEALRSADLTDAEHADTERHDELVAVGDPADAPIDTPGENEFGAEDADIDEPADEHSAAVAQAGESYRHDGSAAGPHAPEFASDEVEHSDAAVGADEDDADNAPAWDTKQDDSLFAAAADALEDDDVASTTENTVEDSDDQGEVDDEVVAAAVEESDEDDATPSDRYHADEHHDPDADSNAVDESDAEAVAQELAAMTGNMAIDADFVRALKDGDFEATMVDEDGAPLVETIVMEGESVSGALTSTSTSIRESLKDPGSLLDTYISLRKDDEKPAWPARRFGVAALIALFAVLVGQVIHHSRESLATNTTFQRVAGPVYELLGSPLVPNWDIRGWQFEATNGGTDEDNSILTIYSRLSNRAEGALPYPLVHVSLTDRYEEIIGSQLLEPSEYLAGNADPERLVASGADFTAVITISEPSADATGFKLNVCYPAGAGDVRCAIEDFKTP